MLDRTIPPPFVQSTSFELLQPSLKTFSNGIEVYYVGGGSQEVVKVELVFRAGRWVEQQTGVAQFTGGLLNKGTDSKSSFEIAQIFDQFGAHLEIQPGLDFVSVAVYSLTARIVPVLELLFEIILFASFPEKELSQQKSITIQNLKVNLEKTSYVASQQFRMKLFGATHPYGVDVDQAAIEAITRNDLTSHFQRFFRDMTVFVSGRIDKKLEEILDDKLTSFMTLPSETEVTLPQAGSLFNERIPKQGSVQATIRMGRKTIRRSHPDYAKAIFTAHLLGGYFGSRLMKNIREEKGLTYGIYASIHPLQHDGYLVIGADVNIENTDLTIEEIRKELRRLREEKIGAEELTTAQNHFIGSLQSEITTPFAHADKIKTLILSQLPRTYYQSLINTIAGMKASDIIQTAEQYFHEDTCSTVTVG